MGSGGQGGLPQDAVLACCMVAQTIAVACCAVHLMAADHYLDDFIAAYRDMDWTAVEDLKRFVKGGAGGHVSRRLYPHLHRG